MAIGLPKYGVDAIVQNVDKFYKDIGGMDKAVEGSHKKISGLGSISMGGIVSSAGVAVTAVAAIGVAAAGVGVIVGKTLFDIAEKSAYMFDIKDAFDRLTERAGTTGEEVLDVWRKASGGVITNIDLMATYNMATRRLGDELATRLPEAFPLLKKAAEASGDSFAGFTQKLIGGIGRLRTAQLAQLGINVDLVQLTEDYAKANGREAKDISKVEQRSLLMAESIRQLTDEYGDLIDGVVESDDVFERMTVTWTNAKDEIKLGISEAMLPLAGQFEGLINQYLPAFIDTIQTRVIPALIAAVTWLGANLPGAIEAATKFFGQMQTTSGQLADFWNTTLKPAIVAVATYLSEKLGPFFRTIADIVMNLVVPALKLVWQWFSTYLLPIITTVARILGAVLGVALRVVWGLLANVLWPAMEKVWRFISEKLGPVFKWLGEQIAAVVDFMTPFLALLNDWADWMASAKLPAWLESHSPSKFEQSLWGIADAMNAISGMSGPSLGQVSAGARVAPVGAGGSVGAGVSNAFNLTVNSSAPREPIVADFRMMQALSRRR